MTAATLFRVTRFSAVGLVSTLLHVGVALVANQAFAVPAQIANALGFIAAFALSYMGHYRWTFRAKGAHRSHLTRFLAVALAGFVASHAITVLVTQTLALDFFWALTVIALTVPALTYVLSESWAFAHREGQGRTMSRWQIASLTTILLLFALVALWLDGTSFNHDTSWYFIATHKWMDGAALYSDIMEINPPLAFYLTRAALSVGDLFALTDANGFRLFLFGSIAVSLHLTDRAMAAANLDDRPRAIMLFGAALAMMVTPIPDFGQREHLLIIFMLPWLMARALRPMAKTPPSLLFEIAVALFALPGLLLKPYFLLVPLFVTVMELWRSWDWRLLFQPANLVFLLGSLGYVGAISAWHPEYIETIVPLGQQVYDAYGQSALDVLTNAGLIAAAFSFLLFRKTTLANAVCQSAGILLTAILALVAAYLIQFKGFPYHAMPVLAVALVFVSLIVAMSDRPLQRIALIYAAIVLTPALLGPVVSGPYTSSVSSDLRTVIGNDSSGRSAMLYSTNVYRAFPFINEFDLEWTSRYPAQWLVPGAYVSLTELPDGDSSERRKLIVTLDYARRTATEDFITHMPDIVIVDVRPDKSYFGSHDFDWIAFLRQDRAFDAAWQSYSLEHRTQEFEIWRNRAKP